MSIRIIGKYLIIIMMLFPMVGYANFEITEIMYDLDGTDTNREWIEVKNISEIPDDLSKWYFFSDNTKHALVPQGESIVPSGSYALIVQNVSQFKTDNPNFTGIIFDSSWTGLKNTGESISLKNPKLEIISPVSFSSGQGGGGDGYSLQKIDGVWLGSKPTPGLENVLTKKTVTVPSKTTSIKAPAENKINKPASAISSGGASDKKTLETNNETINLNEIKTSIPKNKIKYTCFSISIRGSFYCHINRYNFFFDYKKEGK